MRNSLRGGALGDTFATGIDQAGEDAMAAAARPKRIWKSLAGAWAETCAGPGARALAACVLLASMAGAGPAGADNSGAPMVFEWGEAAGLPAIYADGDITPETPEALRAFLRRRSFPPDTWMFLSSLGGDLDAGMEVGRIIREAHLNTGVGRNHRATDGTEPDAESLTPGPYASFCVSACALAFLGGVSRQVEPGSTYAVHQVSLDCVDKREARARFPWVLAPNVAYCPDLEEALAMVQVASGAVVEYVRSMGADPIFLTEMSKAGPHDINALPAGQLDAYRINFTLRRESWSFETDAQGQFLLRYVQGDEWKEDVAELRCERTDAPRLVLSIMHDTRRSTGDLDPGLVIEELTPGILIEWQAPGPTPSDLDQVLSAVLEPEEVISAPAPTSGGDVALSVDVSGRLLDVLMTAEKLHVAGVAPAPGIRPVVLVAMNLDREKIASMARSCR